MKSWFSILMLALVITSCGHSLFESKVKNALANFDNCMNGCDAKKEAYDEALMNCFIETLSQEGYQEKISQCHGDLGCLGAIVKDVKKECEEKNRTLKEDWKNCKRECRDKFPLEIGIH